MDYRIEIKVSGPGMTINTEMALIEKALRDAGIPVDVVNEHPDSPTSNQLSESHIEYCRKRGVKLVANHCPWGG
jgi:hypothetical protein